jgi:hypothetical protein
MNERIKQLAEQVDKEFNSPYDRYKAIERFAELIVAECLACARGAGLADDVAVRNGLGFNDGISEAVAHMKQHFGVEE